MKSASPENYIIKTAEAVIMGIDMPAEISIIGQSKRFWITDIVPLLIDATTGKVVDGNSVAIDDIRVHIIVCNKEMTERPVPLLSLPKYNDELFAGKILEPNEKITFRFDCKALPSQTSAKGNYPLLAMITLKGYEIAFQRQ
jgi:hypothetical protein